MRRIKTLIISTVCLSVVISNPVFALKRDSALYEMYAQNNIIFYDPEGSGAGCFGSGEIVISGTTIEEKIWSGLTSFLTEEQAAGVMGNMQHESGFSPARHETSFLNQHLPWSTITSDTSISYGVGLIQWSFGRRTNMIAAIESVDSNLLTYLEQKETYGGLVGSAFLEAAGDDATNALLSIELQFLRDELTNTPSYSGFLSTTSVYDAAAFFLEHVEIPRNPYISAHPERATDAQNYYDMFAGKTIEGGSGGCTNASGLEGLLHGYVWPTYHEAQYLERMPDYAEAVSRRQSEGKYVGGSVRGVAGIDCGGFVTTILQDSGFEPEYNNGNSNTHGQERWAADHGWTLLNPNGSAMDTSTLQIGDVAFSGGPLYASEHTYLFIGTVEGFETQIASASYSSDGSGGRAPMSGYERLSGDNIRWYRKGGSSGE